MNMTFWYNGSSFEADSGDSSIPPYVPPNQESLKFGATVFTTLRVYSEDLHHPLTQWQAHCDRLTHSLQAFKWQLPNWSALYAGAQLLKRRYPILRVTIFPDGKEWIVGRSLSHQLTHHQQTGVACWVAPSTYTRSLPAHKTGNYLACWLARQQAQSHGAYEAILTNPQGDWLETTTGNLWGWRRDASGQGRWCTPLHNHCLPGIMRRILEKILAESGQIIDPQPWHLKQLLSFEAIAYSNCAVGLVPIHTIFSGATTLEYNCSHDSIKALQNRISLLANGCK
ncbi:MAG: aminotransferase class IV [Phormidesmis sp.]